MRNWKIARTSYFVKRTCATHTCHQHIQIWANSDVGKSPIRFPLLSDGALVKYNSVWLLSLLLLDKYYYSVLFNVYLSIIYLYEPCTGHTWVLLQNWQSPVLSSIFRSTLTQSKCNMVLHTCPGRCVAPYRACFGSVLIWRHYSTPAIAGFEEAPKYSQYKARINR